MKIFMLTSALDVGGAETHIYTLAKKLSALGQVVAVGSSGGIVAARLADEGIRTVYVPIDIRRPFSFLYQGIRLYFFIRREGFDILHGHSRPACFILNIISRLTGIPLVTTVHARFSLSPLYRRLSAWGSVTIAVSEDLRAYVCENYTVDPENTRVIENGVDREAFYGDLAQVKPFRIVFASRLDLDCSAVAFALCRLAPQIFVEYPDAEIVICGGGECLERLREEVSCLDGRIGGRIQLLGQVSDMGAILRSAGIFIGVSRAAIEAMFCYVPVILAGNEGFLGLVRGERELRSGSESNFCCRGEGKLSDSELLAHLRRGLDMTPEGRRSTVSFVRTWVEKAYSGDAMAERTLDVYRELTGRRGRGQGESILLCGYYGFGNLGDNALLRGAIRRAVTSEAGRICAMTAHPWRDCVTFGIPCIHRMNIFSIIRELLRSDLLVFGGGTLFQDSTSLRSFLYYVFIVKLAVSLGCSVELWGNGLGDISRRWCLNFLKNALCDARYIGLRERRSMDLAMLMTEGGSGAAVVCDGDLALSLLPAPDARVDRLLRNFMLRRGGFAVIAVKGTADRESILELEAYLGELWGLGTELLYIPMFPVEDEAECFRLSGIFGGSVARFISEGDVLGLIARSGLVCSMRYHALLFAWVSGVPFVAFGNDPKVRGFERS